MNAVEMIERCRRSQQGLDAAIPADAASRSEEPLAASTAYLAPTDTGIAGAIPLQEEIR